MKKLVIIPSDTIESLIESGHGLDLMEERYNPGKVFDEVYCLFTHEKNQEYGTIKYIKVELNEIKKYIESIKPDLVRTLGEKGAIYGIWNRVPNIPIVSSVHDVNPIFMDQCLKYADKVVCVSNKVKKTVIENMGIEEEKTVVIPNYVNTNSFYKREVTDINDKMEKKYGKGKHILHVGRKAEEKNIETVIRALKYLPEEYSAIFLGNGDVQPYIEIAKREGVNHRCFWEKAVSNKELIYYYSWCDCMCTPSKWEGFGIVFIEAAACSCSIVTSNIAPMNEFLTNGKNAILVDDYLNPIAIAEAIERATKDTKEILEMCEKAREVGLQFSREVVDELVINLYKDVIQKGADNNNIEKIQKENCIKKVILFGAGKNGINLLKNLNQEEVAYFVDNNREKIGEKINGIEVISYEKLLNIHENYRIVVTPFDSKSICEQLIKDNVQYTSLKWFLLLKGIEINNK